MTLNSAGSPIRSLCERLNASKDPASRWTSSERDHVIAVIDSTEATIATETMDSSCVRCHVKQEVGLSVLRDGSRRTERWSALRRLQFRDREMKNPGEQCTDSSGDSDPEKE